MSERKSDPIALQDAYTMAQAAVDAMVLQARAVLPALMRMAAANINVQAASLVNDINLQLASLHIDATPEEFAALAQRQTNIDRRCRELLEASKVRAFLHGGDDPDAT